MISTLSRYLHTLEHNPLVRARWRGTLAANGARRAPVFALPIVAGLVMCGLLYFQRDLAGNPGFQITYLAVLLAGHVTCVVRTLFIASGRMAALLAPGYWDEVILTGLDARQIVLGAWWPAVRATWGWHVALAVVRFGGAVVLAEAVFRHSLASLCSFPLSCYAINNFRYGTPYMPNVEIFMTLQAVCGLFAMSLVNLGLIASMGVFGAVLNRRIHLSIASGVWLGTITTLIIGVQLYVAAVALPFPQLLASYTYFFHLDRVDFMRLIRFAFENLAASLDGGLFFGIDMLRPIPVKTFERILVLVRLASSLTITVFFTFGLLRLAQANLVRRGALKPNQPTFKISWRIIPTNREDVQAQLSLLRRAAGHWRLGEIYGEVAFSLILPVALIPHYIYIFERSLPILFNAHVLYTLVNALLGLRTLSIALRADRRNLSSQSLYAAWWACVRWCLPAHLLAPIFSLGASYGMAQYLHVVSYSWLADWTFAPFYYLSHNASVPSLIYHGGLAVPRPAQFISAYLVLSLSNLFIAMGFSALGLFVTSRFWRRILIVRFGVAINLWTITVIGCGFCFVMLGYPSNHYIPNTLNRILEMIQIALTFPVDNGIIASANYLRVMYFTYYTGSYVTEPPMRFFYVLRNLTSLALACGFMALLTRYALRAARRRLATREAHLPA
jgi:hypothetical protein